VNRHLKSIRSKLSSAELAYLKDVFGVELRDSELIAALNELDLARERLAVFSAAARSSHRDSGEPMSCAFCGGTANAVGPLVEAPDGACICKGCASHCLKLIEEGSA
jgi:ClpX C4-type zinc finger